MLDQIDDNHIIGSAGYREASQYIRGAGARMFVGFSLVVCAALCLVSAAHEGRDGVFASFICYCTALTSFLLVAIGTLMGRDVRLALLIVIAILTAQIVSIFVFASRHSYLTPNISEAQINIRETLLDLISLFSVIALFMFFAISSRGQRTAAFASLLIAILLPALCLAAFARVYKPPTQEPVSQLPGAFEIASWLHVEEFAWQAVGLDPTSRSEPPLTQWDLGQIGVRLQRAGISVPAVQDIQWLASQAGLSTYTRGVLEHWDGRPAILLSVNARPGKETIWQICEPGAPPELTDFDGLKARYSSYLPLPPSPDRGIILNCANSQVSVKELTYVFPNIAPHTEAEMLFSIANTGNTTISVGRLASSCSCTAATTDSASIAPGGTSLIHVSVAPVRDSINQAVVVPIVQNGQQVRTIKLSLLGNYDFAARPIPDSLNFGRTNRDETITRTVRLCEIRDWSIKPTEVDVGNLPITFTWTTKQTASQIPDIIFQFVLHGSAASRLPNDAKIHIHLSNVDQTIDVPVHIMGEQELAQ